MKLIKLIAKLEAEQDDFPVSFAPYPPKPESAQEYQHNYGHEKPVELHEWQWNCTFGAWSRLVTFADGWHGYTYPKI